jgi:hypothetical protein
VTTGQDADTHSALEAEITTAVAAARQGG